MLEKIAKHIENDMKRTKPQRVIKATENHQFLKP